MSDAVITKLKMVQALNVARPSILAMFEEGRMTADEDEKLGAALDAVAEHVEALEAENAGFKSGEDLAAVYHERIKTLEAEVARLREALKPFAEIPAYGASGGPLVAGHVWYEDGSSGYGDAKHSGVRGAIISAHDVRRARAALAGKAGT